MNNITHLIQLLESQYPENHQLAFDLIATSDEFPQDNYLHQLLTKTPERLSKCIELGWLKHLENYCYTLEFNHPTITTLPNNLEQLKEFTSRVLIQCSNIHTFPSVILSFEQLFELEISHSQLTEFPDLQNLPHLETVSFQGNKLTSISNNVGLMPNLGSLDLSKNQITSLSPNIQSLVELYELFLSENKLSKLPKELFKLTNLTTLFLYKNQFTTLPKQLRKLENLSELHLGYNQLTEIPKAIGKLHNLNWLDLSYNQLTELPKQVWLLLKKAYYFTELDLSYNQFTSLPPYLTKLLNVKKGHTQTSLTKLNLAGNPLQSFPEALLSIPELILPKEIPFKEQKYLQKVHKKKYKNCKLLFQ